MARHKDADWNLPNLIGTWERVNTAVLMDIRDELYRLNRILGCLNFARMPHDIKQIRLNTTKRKRKK